VRLFELKEWQLTVREEAYGLLPFRAILKRDKSRNKDTALKEMLFIYYYTDIKSDYLIIEPKARVIEIIKDIGLPEDWKIDIVMQTAIDFYESKSLTVLGKLYKSSLKAANDTSEYLEMADVLLRERTNNGGTVTTLPMITSSLEKVPKIMQNLKASEKELLKEQIELDNRMKGSQRMGMFEDGLLTD